MRLAVISDSHVPSREPSIPEWVLDQCREADHVIHAGDFDAPETLETVREASPELTAVHGNIDPDLGLPSVATLDVEGVRFVVTHGTGDIEGYEECVAGTVAANAASGPTVGVSGHTHEVMDREVDGYRLLNPGSCTGASPADSTTMMAASVEDGSVDVTVHEG
ncbi:metallophosphoesterase family protein [Salinirubellus sp. GCM10025818]|uniref:metallophosphoesterase family protein n=1 Tax=Salinirubellus TaxID=2162630 RepID=UPI0030D11271